MKVERRAESGSFPLLRHAAADRSFPKWLKFVNHINHLYMKVTSCKFVNQLTRGTTDLLPLYMQLPHHVRESTRHMAFFSTSL
jgi:hypothetical protein